jgi:hypothetical protein
MSLEDAKWFKASLTHPDCVDMVSETLASREIGCFSVALAGPQFHGNYNNTSDLGIITGTWRASFMNAPENF